MEAKKMTKVYLSFSEINNSRKTINDKLQQELDDCKSYEDKLVFIYDLINNTNGEFLKYTKNEFLTDKYLDKLKEQLIHEKDLTDAKFYSFIEKNVLNKVNTPHLSMSYINPKLISDNNHKDISSQNDDISNLTLTSDNIEENIILQKYKDIMVLKIKSFSNKHLKKDKEKLETLSEYLKLYPDSFNNIIIDIRGNDGGTDEYFNYLKMFTNTSVIYTDKFYNTYTKQNESITQEIISSNPDVKNYDKYLLVDDKVFSAADTLSRMSKETGFATIIGSKTAGEGYGFTPLNLKLFSNEKEIIQQKGLKATIDGVSISLPIEAPINDMGDIDYENHYATSPDYYCDPDDALEVAFHLIKEKELKKEEKDLNLGE